MPRFTEIFLLTTEISHHAKQVLMDGRRDGQQTHGQMTRQHNAFRRILLAVEAQKLFSWWQWASCLLNLWEFCHNTPLEYLISLICWSLGRVCLLDHIYPTLTTLHRSKIPLRLIWSTCSVFFYFDLFILINSSGIFKWYNVVNVR